MVDKDDRNLVDLLDSLFLDMEEEKFNRIDPNDVRDLMLEAYLHVAKQGVDANEIDPDDMKAALFWCVYSLKGGMRVQ